MLVPIYTRLFAGLRACYVLNFGQLSWAFTTSLKGVVVGSMFLS